MNAADTGAAADQGSLRRAGYRRSAGSPRGEARRRELLDRVADDLAVNGLVDFSLRRAARAAGTTHKVLLYHFDGADDLLTQAILQLRERRIDNALAVSAAGPGRTTMAARVRAVWQALVGEESRVLDQAIGLTMYDPGRYAELGRGASQRYLPSLLSLCPEHWSGQAQAGGIRDDPRGPARVHRRLAGQREHHRGRGRVRRPGPRAGAGRGGRRIAALNR